MDIEARIKAYKAQYLDQLSQWVDDLPGEQLGLLVETLAGARRESEEISALLKRKSPVTFEVTWRPLLEQTNETIAALTEKVEALQRETQEQLNALQKGSRLLSGYRQGKGPSKFLETDG